MTAQAPDEESHFALILGKPGGGKGTISGKILKVGILVFFESADAIKHFLMLFKPQTQNLLFCRLFFYRISLNSTTCRQGICFVDMFAKRPS
jgi:hypothetical protein